MPAVSGALWVENVFNNKSMFLIFLCTPKIQSRDENGKSCCCAARTERVEKVFNHKIIFLTTTEC